MKADTQCAKILAILKRGDFVTSYKMYDLCGTVSPQRRLSDLRAKGYVITSDWKTLVNGKRIKFYRLDTSKGKE
jgi:hypothetical protein